MKREETSKTEVVSFEEVKDEHRFNTRRRSTDQPQQYDKTDAHTPVTQHTVEAYK